MMAVQVTGGSLTSDSDSLSLRLLFVRHLEQPPRVLVRGGDGECRKRQDGDEDGGDREKSNSNSSWKSSRLFLSPMLWRCGYVIRLQIR
jgi:hypothetical protein